MELVARFKCLIEKQDFGDRLGGKRKFYFPGQGKEGDIVGLSGLCTTRNVILTRAGETPLHVCVLFIATASACFRFCLFVCRRTSRLPAVPWPRRSAACFVAALPASSRAHPRGRQRRGSPLSCDPLRRPWPRLLP